jgi:hypothetical protein
MNVITNTPNTPVPVNTRTVIESNYMGGKWIDRLYQIGITDTVELINKDSTKYKGRVYRRRITLQNTEGQNFFAVAYESADGRWFDNCGMPIKKPINITKESGEEEVSTDLLSQ